MRIAGCFLTHPPSPQVKIFSFLPISSFFFSFPFIPFYYVRADVRLDPGLEDMIRIRADELSAVSPDEVVILARRVTDPLEDRILEAAIFEEHREEMVALGHGFPSISLQEFLKSREKLSSRVEGGSPFLDCLKQGYALDPVIKKVLDAPTAFLQFKVEDGLIYARNVAGKYCLGIPRSAEMHALVIDEAHSTIGHLADDKTSVYLRRWYWWPKLGQEVEKFCASCGACAMVKTHNQAPAMCAASGENATVETKDVCLRICSMTASPVFTPHTQMVLSSELDAMRAPSGEN